MLKSVCRIIDHPDMTSAVNCGRKARNRSVRKTNQRVIYHRKGELVTLQGIQIQLQKNVHAIYSVFYGSKNEFFLDKKKMISFLIFAQNIDCGYTLELPQ